MSKWIHCKIKLPNSLTEVLVMCNRGNMFVAFLEDNEWYLGYAGYNLSHITHWMPLPEPPK